MHVTILPVMASLCKMGADWVCALGVDGTAETGGLISCFTVGACITVTVTVFFWLFIWTIAALELAMITKNTMSNPNNS